MEKSIREWLETIADDTIRTEAIEAFEQQRKSVAISLEEALDYGFIWDLTHQRHDYWYNINQEAKAGTLATRPFLVVAAEPAPSVIPEPAPSKLQAALTAMGELSAELSKKLGHKVIVSADYYRAKGDFTHRIHLADSDGIIFFSVLATPAEIETKLNAFIESKTLPNHASF